MTKDAKPQSKKRSRGPLSELGAKIARVRKVRLTQGRAAGRQAWIDEGLPPVDDESALMGARANNVQVEAWISARVRVAPGQRTRTNVLYADFVSWCERGGREVLSIRAFAEDLRRVGYPPFHSNGVWRIGIVLDETSSLPTLQ